MSQKALPASVTTYDILKTVAVVTMIIDHIGAYTLPGYEYFRVIGRLSAPSWFFLIGYARTREIPMKLLAGGAILECMDFICGLPLLALDNLFTIALIRKLLDFTAHLTFRNKEGLIMAPALFLLLALPTALITDYGTAGLAFALLGYVIRNRPVVASDGQGRDVLPLYAMALALAVYLPEEEVFFSFSTLAFLVMAVETGALVLILRGFTGRECPGLTARLPRPAIRFLQFCGRRTLEIYVVHLCILKPAAAYLFPDKFSWFHPALIL